MTAPEESQERLQIPVVPFQAPPPAIEVVVPRQRTVPEPLVVNLHGWHGRIFGELVELAQNGNARVLGGYLEQRARTPAASRRELAAQRAVQRRDPGDRQAATEIRCLQTIAYADFLVRLPTRFLPDDLRPWHASSVLTATALELLVQDPTYANLTMQARAMRGEKPRKDEHNFLRELGFYTLGWAVKRVAWQRNGLHVYGSATPYGT